MIEGFCHHCRSDVTARSDETRPTCSVCGWYPLIPPSYGRRTQTWINGTWEPFIPKPTGYIWKDPQVRAQELLTAPAGELKDCAWCRTPFTRPPRSVKKYCCDLCKSRANDASRPSRQKAAS